MKISEASEYESLSGNEFVPAAKDGTQGKVKMSTLKAFVQSGTGLTPLLLDYSTIEGNGSIDLGKIAEVKEAIRNNRGIVLDYNGKLNMLSDYQQNEEDQYLGLSFISLDADSSAVSLYVIMLDINTGTGETGVTSNFTPSLTTFGEQNHYLSGTGEYIQIPEVPTKTSQLQNDNGFVTMMEVEEKGYETSEHANQTYQPKGDYLTEVPSDYVTDKEQAQALEDYATKEYVDNAVGQAQGRYALAEWTEGELDPEAASFVGDPGLLTEWDPLLLDTTDNAGEVTTPVGGLKRNNYLRFEDGSFAPTVGITEEQRAQCDVELYLDSSHAMKYCDAGAFDAEAFYNEYGMSQKLYNVSGEEITHILRPWETVETKYTVGVANRQKLYLVDQVKGKSGKVWRGVSESPKTYDGIDVSQYPLERTAYSPSPVCTVGGKTRSFFYLYEGENNCKSSNGQNGLCTMFSNGRTYPRVNDMQQINNMNYARANNADTEKPYPFAEGGYHALNAFLTCMEVFYRTKYLHQDTFFGSGISSNDACSNEDTWKLHGGVRYKLSSASDWKYSKWSEQGDIYYSESQERTNFTTLLNLEYPKQQCMEAQMAASFAVETGVPEGEEFEFYGGTYWYQTPTGALGLNDGEMNVRVYKRMSQTFTAYDADGSQQSWNVEVILRMSLMEGMNLSGDVFAYSGGGYEQVGTVKYLQDTQRTGNPVDIYIQPMQKQWVRETESSKNSLGTFGFEGSYMKIGTFENISDGYYKVRVPFSGWKKENGGNISQGECCYSWSNNYWGNTIDQRVRIAARFRGTANNGYCSPRALTANAAVTNAFRHNAGSAQALVGATPPQAE